MLQDISILAPFFISPIQTFSARQIASYAHIHHYTVAKILQNHPCIQRSPYGPYMGYKAIHNDTFYYLKKIYNIHSLWTSKLIEHLLIYYQHPTLVLFGSYATGHDTQHSDIDIAIICSSTKTCDTTVFEKVLQRPVHLFLFQQSELTLLKKKNAPLLNSICNGIILAGELEVFI